MALGVGVRVAVTAGSVGVRVAVAAGGIDVRVAVAAGSVDVRVTVAVRVRVIVGVPVAVGVAAPPSGTSHVSPACPRQIQTSGSVGIPPCPDEFVRSLKYAPSVRRT